MTTEIINKESDDDVTLQTLNDATQHGDIMNVMNVLLPKWIEGVADKYAPEYAGLEKTWDDLCEKVKAKKNKILIVSYLPMTSTSDNDQYIGIIADMLVSKGYLLRRPSELIICPNTGDALVSKKMFSYFKRYNNVFPKKWYPHALDTDQSELEGGGGSGDACSTGAIGLNNVLNTPVPSDEPVEVSDPASDP